MTRFYQIGLCFKRSIYESTIDMFDFRRDEWRPTGRPREGFALSAFAGSPIIPRAVNKTLNCLAHSCVTVCRENPRVSCLISVNTHVFTNT